MRQTAIILFLFQFRLVLVGYASSPAHVGSALRQRQERSLGMVLAKISISHTIQSSASTFCRTMKQTANASGCQPLSVPVGAAWWVVHEEIQSDRDKRLMRKLVICRGCLRQSWQSILRAAYRRMTRDSESRNHAAAAEKRKQVRRKDRFGRESAPGFR
jgi:hypothetical protein